MIKQLTMIISDITFPLMFILLLLAKPIFILLYTDKWLNSVPYFQILYIAGLFECLQSTYFWLISAIGKSKTSFVWTMVKRSMGISIMLLGLVLWGMKGLLIGVVLSSVFSYAVNIGLVSKYIGYKWYHQLKDLFPVFVVSSTVAVACYWLGSILHLELYTDGVLKVCLFTVLYLGWSFVFRPQAFTFFRLTVIPLFANIIKKISPKRKSA